MLAGSFGGMTWSLLDYRVTRKFGMVGFCSGTIAGLVGATSACGFIPPWAAVLMGIVCGCASNLSTKSQSPSPVTLALIILYSQSPQSNLFLA